MAPFLGALALIVLVVSAITVSNLLRGNDLSPEERVGEAVVGQNDALQREDYAAFRRYTCAAEQSTEADFTAQQRDSLDKRGHRVVQDVVDIKVDGDRATATVQYEFEKVPDTTSGAEMTFVREDGAWKVCSTGPS